MFGLNSNFLTDQAKNLKNYTLTLRFDPATFAV